MHRVLLIDEVMVQILSNLRRSSEVAAMARVCRAFNELASDVIWKEIPSILPLIMCMPMDLVKKTYMKGGILRVSFTRDLVPEDWKKFHYYAARVRTFRRVDTSSHSLRLDKTVSIAFGLDNRPYLNLFPRLQSLEVPSDIRDGEFQFLHLMIGPQLKSFKMYSLDASGKNRVSANSIASLFERLGSCHSLTHIVVINDNQLVSAFADIATRMPSLHTLQLHPFQISPEGLMFLSGNIFLKSVSFRLEEGGLLAFIKQLSLQSRPFPVLENIYITTPDLNTCTSFIRTFNTYQLKEFRLRLATAPTLAAMESHISTLHNFCSHTALKTLGISFYPNGREITSPDLIINSGILRPLFVLRGLVDVTIHLPNHFVLDNAFISDLASSWPLLRTLILEGLWPKPHRITLEGLLPLAQKCLHLIHLDLTIDGTAPPPRTKTRPGNGVSNSSLIYLQVNQSDVKDEEEVAEYLSDIFPRMIEIESAGGREYSWDRVSTLTQLFGRIRQQERTWAQRI